MKLLFAHEVFVMGVLLPTVAITANVLVWTYSGDKILSPLYLALTNAFFLSLVGYLMVTARMTSKQGDAQNAGGLINRQTKSHSFYEPFNNGMRNVFWGVYLAIWLMVGFGMGRYNFLTNREPWLLTEQGSFYENVSPTSSAAGRADAGVLHFNSVSTHLNANMARSYISKKNEYCVAPVMNQDSSTENQLTWIKTSPPTVQYFAAGINCCEGNTFTCCENGDCSGVFANKYGVVVRRNWNFDSTRRTPPQDVLIEDDLAMYQKAGQSAAAYYGLGIADKPLYVVWSGDANALQLSRTSSSASAILFGVLLCLLVSTVLSFLIFLFVKRRVNKALNQAEMNREQDV